MVTGERPVNLTQRPYIRYAPVSLKNNMRGLTNDVIKSVSFWDKEGDTDHNTESANRTPRISQCIVTISAQI